ncbi:MAG: ComEC/Rec2 family competence protein [Verrucomicrobiales bacterium]|nr:ComEC/Rec2 family competence protein [Verrucomicrobiales bacterium]
MKMRFPLTIVALLYAGGIVLGQYATFPLWLLFASSLMTALAGVCSERHRQLWLCVLLVLFGWTNLITRTAILSPFDLRRDFGEAPQVVSVRGKLIEAPEQRVFIRDDKPSWRTLAKIAVTQIGRDADWQKSDGRVAVSTAGVLPPNFFAGQPVEIIGTLQLPKGPAAEGLFDYRSFLRHQGIYYFLQVERTNDWKLRDGDARKARPWNDRFRDWAQRVLAKGLPEEDEPLRLLWAMVLGWKPALTQEIAEPFMQSGTLHVFAISGLHIALIAGILVSLLRVFQIPRGACGLVVIPLIWFYTAATGWQASAVRSTVMMTIIIGGWALKRPSHLLNSLAGAGLIILVWEPTQLFQAGFQLSFFVVLGLALITPPFEKMREWLLRPDPLLPDELRPRWQRWTRTGLGWLTASIATSLAAWLGSLPLIAYYFYLVTPVSLAANLLIVPLSSIALASSLGSLICGDWLPWCTVLFNHSSWFWMKLMIAVSEWAAGLPNAFFYVRPPTLIGFAIYYVLLAGILSGWVFRPARWKWAVPTTAAIILISCFVRLRQPTYLKITVLPLGGSGIVANAPGTDSDLLIDCANASGADFMLKPFLRSQGVNHISNLLLTHGDLHHVEGFDSVTKDFGVSTVLTSSLRFRSQTYRGIVERLERNSPPWRQVHRGDQIGQWRVLHPAAADRFALADDAALVLSGEFDDCRILFLSDLGKRGQQLLVEREADLRADIVITGIPHQGEALIPALLEAISPQVILVGTANYPASARMNRTLRQRLETLETPLIDTDGTGAATVLIRSREWQVKTLSGIHLIGTARSAPRSAPVVARPD